MQGVHRCGSRLAGDSGFGCCARGDECDLECWQRPQWTPHGRDLTTHSNEQVQFDLRRLRPCPEVYMGQDIHFEHRSVPVDCGASRLARGLVCPIHMNQEREFDWYRLSPLLGTLFGDRPSLWKS